MDARDHTDLTERERLAVGDFIDRRTELAKRFLELGEVLAGWERDGDAARHAVAVFADELKLFRAVLSRAVFAMQNADKRRKRERGG